MVLITITGQVKDPYVSLHLGVFLVLKKPNFKFLVFRFAEHTAFGCPFKIKTCEIMTLVHDK